MCCIRTSGTGSALSRCCLDFFPVGLVYHLGYSMLATLMMVVLVRFAWPTHLEKYEPRETSVTNHHREDKP